MKIKKLYEFETHEPIFKKNPDGWHIDLYIGINCPMDSEYHLRTHPVVKDRRIQLANDIENMVYTTLLDRKDTLGILGLSIGDNSFEYRDTYVCKKYLNTFGAMEIVCKAYGLSGIANPADIDLEPFIAVKNEIAAEIRRKLKNETVSISLRIVKDLDDNVFVDAE